MSRVRIAVIMACHNRIEVTRRCLQALEITASTQNLEISLFAVDDGSSDGTSDELLKYSFTKILIEGTGNWYWARSMSIAQSMVPDDYDAILWLNDDVILFEESFEILNRAILENDKRILIGQLASPDGGSITYGGIKQVGWRKNNLQLIDSPDELNLVKTFNGNFVYVPMQMARLVGQIDGKFLHGYADIDYGLRAIKAGVPIFVMPEVVGECASNTSKYSETLRQLFFEKKGTPLRSQLRFFIRHGGPEWPIYVIYPFYKHFWKKITKRSL